MYVTKRNGSIVLYDNQNVVRSILAANRESGEIMPRRIAFIIANTVLEKLPSTSSIVLTSDIRNAVKSELQARGYARTAANYAKFAKSEVSNH